VSRACVIIGGALLLQAWLVLGADILGGHVRDVVGSGGARPWCAPLCSRCSAAARALQQGKPCCPAATPRGASVIGWVHQRQARHPRRGPCSRCRAAAALVGDSARWMVFPRRCGAHGCDPAPRVPQRHRRVQGVRWRDEPLALILLAACTTRSLAAYRRGPVPRHRGRGHRHHC
jgi:hypothetical protein